MAITSVQSGQATSSMGTMVAVILPSSNIVVGNKVVVFVSSPNGDIGASPTVTDNLGNTYTSQFSATGVAPSGCIFTATVTTGGSCTITLTVSVSMQLRIVAIEYSGTNLSIGTASGGITSGPSPLTGVQPWDGAATTEALISAIQLDSTSSFNTGPSAPWSLIQDTITLAGDIQVYGDVTGATGTAAPVWTLTGAAANYVKLGIPLYEGVASPPSRSYPIIANQIFNPKPFEE